MLPLHRIVQTATVAAVAAALTACGGSDGHGDHDHEHEGHVHVAPNGGTLVELGDHVANVEFLLDSETGEMTMFALGAHAETSLRSPSESVTITIDNHGESTFDVVLAAQAAELSGETVGDSSKFVGKSDDLVGVDHFHGLIKTFNLKGTEWTDVTFDFPGEHDHDHGEGEGHDEHSDDDSHDGGESEGS
ncbi:MAG: hypothetical protein AAGB93_14310 [Planctomycetota bacterium]